MTDAYCKNKRAYTTVTTSGSGTGDVVGPASSTDNALARFDGTTGKLLQNSNVTLDDTGNMALAAAGSLQTDTILMPGTVDTGDVLTIAAGDNTADRTLTLTAGTNLNLTLDSGAFELGSNISIPSAATASAFSITGGSSTGSGAAGGEVQITGGAGTSGNAAGGDVVLTPGARAGSGTLGKVEIVPEDVANTIQVQITPGGTSSRLVFGRTSAGTYALNLTVGGLFGWSAGVATAGNDTGFVRPAAATIKAVGSTTTALGYLLSGVPITVNTGTATPAITDSGTFYTNTGDADGSTITLPNDPTIGTTFEAYSVENQAITIAPSAGESIRDGASTGTTNIASSTQGAWIRLVAVTGGSGAVWGVAGKSGTWTLT